MRVGGVWWFSRVGEIDDQTDSRAPDQNGGEQEGEKAAGPGCFMLERGLLGEGGGLARRKTGAEIRQRPAQVDVPGLVFVWFAFLHIRVRSV